MMNKNILEHEDIFMQDDVYSTRELSNALPFADVNGLVLLLSSSSLSSSSPPPLPNLQRQKKTCLIYTPKDITTVLRAFFFQGLGPKEAGAIMGMPKSTTSRLIRTYRPQMPAPPPRPCQPRGHQAQARPSMISKINNDILAAVLQQ